MEDRLSAGLGTPHLAREGDGPHRAAGTERGLLPLLALLTILVVTAGWWALALWPLPSTAPEWLLRTREICFGSAPDGLPLPGGWILLVGEPIGMLLVLFTVWGGAVHQGLRRLLATWAGRLAVGTIGLAVLLGMGAAGARVAGAQGVRFVAGDAGEGRLVRLNDRAPALRLVDQRGDTVSLQQFRGRPVLVTFAFAHCETVCPLLVRAALETRRRFDAERLVALVVTLDPWRDTPARLPALAAQWELGTDEYVLSGSVDAVENTLNAWKVPRVRNQATGDLIHPSVTYVVEPGGRLVYLTDGSGRGLEKALGGER
ncbi:MAG TPA: SCO family protein [Gemmatimonadales bacterium]